MQMVIFGGNSVKNREWVEAIAKLLAQDGNSVYAHMYSHWQTGEPDINLDRELDSLANNSALQDDYCIVAKSMGSVLAIKGIYSGVLRPASCIFSGLPLKMINQNTLPVTAWLAALHCPTQFIQNHADPLGTYAEVHRYVAASGISATTIDEWQGNTHDYPSARIASYAADMHSKQSPK